MRPTGPKLKVMQDPFFFGYGSLVNRATHDYPSPYHASVKGWRRAWQGTRLRKVAYLTVVPAHGEEIDGLIAAVPGHDWAALDKREGAYQRHPVSEHVEHGAPHEVDVQLYAVHHEHATPREEGHPILLSYLDVVVQGYLQEFGEKGAIRFFDTTDGWDMKVLDDRAAPIYPRHQRLRPEETAFVNDQIDKRRIEITRERG